MDGSRVVIIGGGFGGLACIRALVRSPVAITLLDRSNHSLFQPLLYQVATGGLAPSSIATPLRTLLRRRSTCQVLLGTATGIDPSARRLLLEDGSLPYDTVVVACGSRPSYFGHDAWATHAPGLKTVADAERMRQRIFQAFERAERATDPGERQRELTFAIIGGGPTGVELAGAIAEIAVHTLHGEFRSIDPAQARILLLEAGDQLLPGFAPSLRQRAERDLQAMQVEVWCSARVTAIDDTGVTYDRHGQPLHLATRTVLWAAGVAGEPLAKTLAETLHVPLDRHQRLVVGPDCTLPGHPEIFAIGDIASYADPAHGGQPLPGVAQVALQQGRYVGRLVHARLEGRTLPPFRYRNLGTMATIGKRRAVAQIGSWAFGGLLAYFAWAFLHIARLATVQSRLLVLVQWLWYYVSWDRGARLITLPEPRAAAACPPPASAASGRPLTATSGRTPGPGGPPPVRAAPEAPGTVNPASPPGGGAPAG